MSDHKPEPKPKEKGQTARNRTRLEFEGRLKIEQDLLLERLIQFHGPTASEGR